MAAIDNGGECKSITMALQRVGMTIYFVTHDIQPANFGSKGKPFYQRCDLFEL